MEDLDKSNPNLESEELEGIGDLVALPPQRKENPAPTGLAMALPPVKVDLVPLEKRLGKLENDFVSNLKLQSEIRTIVTTLAKILAPRALLLIAMLGALGLTVPALLSGAWQQLLAAVSFDVLVFWPTAYLYMKD